MVRGGIITLIVALAAPSLAAAQTVSFGEGAAMLGKSCGADIVANCRGVNIDTTRLKDCLYRNQDVMSAQCKADYPRALDAIQKRIAARLTVGRECEYEVVKKCGGKGKEVFKSLSCLLALPTTSARCVKSIADVGYRATDDVATKLSSLETPLELDITALRAQTAERSKSRAKNEPPPQKRPPIAPDLNKLPTVNMDIQFDADTPIVKPESYARLGQLADTLEALPEWNHDACDHASRAVAEAGGVKAGLLINATRVAIVGQAVAPPLFDTMVVLGQQRVVRRLRDAVASFGKA